MSHFSTLKVQVKDVSVADSIFKTFNWTKQHCAEYVNPWTSREKVTDCTVIKNTSDKVMMVIAKNGDVIHDSYYMGHDAEKFLQKYTEAYIHKVAVQEGAQVTNYGADKHGNIILEVNYAYA
jgi:hypothetical protein